MYAMHNVLHITSGDIVGESLRQAGLPGEVFVWHDILYDGPRLPGWLDAETLAARSVFLEKETGGGLKRDYILETLQAQYRKLQEIDQDVDIVLWFDACLFDQSMLAHILMCLDHVGLQNVELLCIDHFPGIDPYHGIGQLQPKQLAALYENRTEVTDEQYRFAIEVDLAFATQDVAVFETIAAQTDASLPWIPATVQRWLQERPNPNTGLGRLEQLAFDAVVSGCDTPSQIFAYVSQADTPPQYWGDITLWAKINGLADRALLRITGPQHRLPHWESELNLSDFHIKVA